MAALGRCGCPKRLTAASRGSSGRLLAPGKRRLIARSTSTEAAEAEPQQKATVSLDDPFVQAVLRLERLTHAVGDGEDELLELALREQTPLTKLGVMAAGGLAIGVTALVVSLLAGQDPLGGASLSVHSLQSAAVGAALAIPLVAIRAYLWTPAAAEALPPLEDMHRLMAEEAEPWLCQFNRAQLAAHAALEVLPVTMLLLPAAQGGVAAAFDFYSSLIKSTLLGGAGGAGAGAVGDAAAAAAAAAAPHLPSGLGAVLALGVTATAAGVAQSLNLVADEAQVDVVRDAVQNADRFYRVTSMRVGSTTADAARAAMAFKAVAVAWVEAREDASALAGAITFLDVISFSAIWYATGDLTAAAVAALAVSAVDYHHLANAAAGGGGGGGRRRRGGGSGGE